MFGANMGNLKVEVETLSAVFKLLWRLVGDQGNSWKRAQVPVEGDTPFRVNCFYLENHY